RDVFPYRRCCKAYFKDQLSIGGSSHQFISAPLLQGPVELVVRSVGSSTVVTESVSPGVGNKYLVGSEDLPGQRCREHLLLVLRSQTHSWHARHRKSRTYENSFHDL